MPEQIITKKLYERRNAEFTLEPSFPTKQLSIELSNICNHRCVFCPHSKMTRKKTHIDENLFYRVLREAYDLGMREVGLYILGEPFVSSNLAVYIKAAKDMGYSYVYITTNGALATPKNLKDVFEAGLDSIKFSINAGSRDTYRDIHGSDDYNKVLANVKWCAEYRKMQGIRHFNLLCSYVVTAQSESEAVKFKTDYSDIFDEIAFLKVMNRGGMMPETEKMMPLTDGKNKTDICAHPFNCVYITCEGYLSPCALDSYLDLKVGDLNQTSLKDAWYGDDMKKFRQRFLDGFHSLHKQCQACYENESILANILDINANVD